VLADGLKVVSVTSNDGECQADLHSVECQYPVIGSGDAVSVIIEVDTDPAITDDVENQASADGDTDDPDPTNNEDLVSAVPEPSADLSVVKTAPAQVTTGNTITYTITVTNQGPSIATDVVVTDQLPDGVLVTDASVAVGDCVNEQETVVCSLGNLVPDRVVTLTIVAFAEGVDEPTVRSNTVTVESATPDPDTSDNTSTTDTTVNPAPVEAALLRGTVWYDRDRDGVIDPAETGIEGVTATVAGDPDGDGTDEQYTLTSDQAGHYSVALPPGGWSVVVDATTAPDGMAPTTEVTADRTIAAGQVATIETGFGHGHIEGTVWDDGDGDGIFDPGEQPLPGVVVIAVFPGPDQVLGTDDDVLFHDTTDGTYSFDQVPVGQPYEVRVDRSTIPIGFTPTYDPDGVLDSATTGVIDDVTSVTVIDFGYTPPPEPKREPEPPRIPKKLAFTGSKIGLLIGLAAVLVVIGGALLALQARIRRSLGEDRQ
jgi:uncharacterized repeat protein (TIGR01451 family)